MISQEILFANQVATLQSYPDELPALLYPTSEVVVEQSLNHLYFVNLIVQTGLPVYICHMFAESQDSLHYLQVIAGCNMKFRVFHLTCEENKFHISCEPQNTYYSEVKTL